MAYISVVLGRTIPQSAIAADSSLYTREPLSVSFKETILQNLKFSLM